MAVQKKRRGTRKPEELYAELERHALRQRLGETVTGPMVRFTFQDGTIELIPLELLKRIDASQHGILRGMLGGTLGGRPTERPSNDKLFLMFGDHWLRSGHRHAVARRSFMRELRKEFGISLKTARRWVDAALGKPK